MAANSGVGAALLKFALGISEKAAGSAIASAIRWLTGKKVLIVGQDRSGKTCFRNYLRYGLLEDETNTPKTHDVTRTGSFSVKLGRDRELELICRSAIELPGQEGPVSHANHAFKERPHAIIILSDLTAQLNGKTDKAAATWLEEFCKRLEMHWRGQKPTRNRLESMILLLNKCDKVSDETVQKRTKALGKIIEAELAQALGRMKRRVEIMPCVSVNNPNGPKLLDAVVTHLAKTLAGEA